MMKPLEGKVALVTGASRGIGKGIALELGAAGATVYVTGRTRAESQDVPAWASSIEQAGTIDAAAAELTELGSEGIAVYCDHARDGQVEAVFDQIRSEHGRLDILVNNVCWNGLDTMLGKPFWELTDIDGVIPDDSHKAGAADGDVPSFWKDVLGES